MAFLGIYRAVYDYSPQSDEELQIHAGDLLFILEKSAEDDWWKCRKKAASDDDDEPEGLVPNNYVEEAEPSHTAKALYDYTKQTDEELSFKEESRLDVYDESDPDWTLVGCNGEYGFAPSIYIEATTASVPAAPAPSSSPAPPPMPARPQAAEDPIPGEADYVPPSSSHGPPANSPAAALAGIIAQKTGGGQNEPSPVAQRALAAAPPPSERVQYTPEESEEEEAPPPKPQRPQSRTILSPTVASPTATQYASPRSPELSPAISSPPARSNIQSYNDNDYDEPQQSPRGFHLYNIHEYITHMGKNKKLPTTFGINVSKGIIMIAPEKSRDGPSKEWTADRLSHYSIEGKHVFIELVRPSKSVDFHAGAKDTAQEIVAHLGELAGASRLEGLREVWAASAGTGAAGMKKGQMLYEFMAQGEDEVTVAVGDEVIVLDDSKSEEWWMVRRLRNGKEGVVPSSYVEVTGTMPKGSESVTGLNAARSTVEQNRLEEERLAKEAARKDKKRSDTVGPDMALPERGSSLAGETAKGRDRGKRGSKDGAPKSKPNSSRVRTWTDRSGTFKVEAEFIGLREGKIHLHKMNGVKIAVPVAKMAVEDLEYVERATGASLDEDKPLSDIKRKSTQKAASKANGTRGMAGASVEKKSDYDWFDFFLGAGVNPQICERYAGAFSRDQMGPEVLPDVNEQLLRTLGLKEGDILRVMKHLDSKYDRKRTPSGGAPALPGQDDSIEPANGGLFSGPGGVLKQNTRKGRPAPAVQTNDVVSDDAFKTKEEKEDAWSPGPDAKATPLTTAPAREPKGGFEDDAWDVKPARTQTRSEAPKPAEPPQPIEPPKPKVNDDIVSLSLTSPPLQPTPAPAPAPIQSPQQTAQPEQPAKPQGADQDIFNKIASLAPARQRPEPPAPQPSGASLGMPPPPRASSAPGFQPQQNSFGPPPLQPQLTGYNPQQQQFQQQVQPHQTAFQSPQGGYPGAGLQGQQPNGPNGFMPPQQTGIQTIQQNYPALQPQPTGLNFQPQSHFGQHQQSQTYGAPQPQPNYQQQLVNGAQSGSPFADPPRQPFQPAQPSGLQNSFSPQQTGFQQPQPSFSIAQATGLNGYPQQQQQQPQLPPQQTGGVFGPPSQSTGLHAPPAPLVQQKTGPAPPVRFGVQPGQNKLVPQPTGRADLSKASEYILLLHLSGESLSSLMI